MLTNTVSGKAAEKLVCSEQMDKKQVSKGIIQGFKADPMDMMNFSNRRIKFMQLYGIHIVMQDLSYDGEW